MVQTLKWQPAEPKKWVHLPTGNSTRAAQVRYVDGREARTGWFAWELQRLEDRLSGQAVSGARFVVPICDPVSHVHSLVKQHRLFSEYAAQDPRIPKYLMAAGPYEFGPQRKPINIHRDLGDRIANAWRRGDEYRGDAALRADVYGYMATLVAQQPGLAERIHVVDYDELCRSPREQVARILDFADLDHGAAVLDRLDHIEAPAPEAAGSDDDRRAVASEAGSIAAHYGYLVP